MFIDKKNGRFRLGNSRVRGVNFFFDNTSRNITFESCVNFRRKCTLYSKRVRMRTVGLFMSATSGETIREFDFLHRFRVFIFWFVYSLLATVDGGRHSTSRVSDGRSRTGTITTTTTASVAVADRCCWSLPLLLLITVGHRDGGGGVVGSRPVHERLANRNTVCPIFSSRYTHTRGRRHYYSTFFQARRPAGDST